VVHLLDDLGPPVSGVAALVTERSFGIGPPGEVAIGPDAADGTHRIVVGRRCPRAPAPFFELGQRLLGCTLQELSFPVRVEDDGRRQLGHLGSRKGAGPQGFLGARQLG